MPTDIPTDQSIRVAIVEDDFETRVRLAAAVEAQEGMRLSGCFATGNAALSGLDAAAPDVLLVDIGLPDISGIEIIRTVAARMPQCDVLVISMFGDEANVMAALEAGGRGYLLKGSLSDDLAGDIRDLRAGGSPLSPIIARQLLRKLQGDRNRPTVVANEDAVTLSRRETEILNAISRGFSYSEVAEMLGIASATVHAHLKRIYGKLAVHSKTEAVYEAGRLGLLP